MAVPFHRSDQSRNQRAQQLATDPIRGFPHHDQRLSDSILIYAAPRPRPRPSAGLTSTRQPHRVLAMQIAYRNEFIQNSSPIHPVAPSVPSRQRNHQPVACRHTDPPHLRPRACLPLGSRLSEATGRFSGASQARQCGQKGAAATGVRPLARRLLDQNPSQDRSRRESPRLPSDGRRGQRQHTVRDVARHRARTSARASR